MASICVHEFNKEDPQKPGYSLIEFDLAAKTGASIRKNIKFNAYEIFDIKTGNVRMSSTSFENIVKLANELEGENFIQIKCGLSCPFVSRGGQIKFSRDGKSVGVY